MTQSPFEPDTEPDTEPTAEPTAEPAAGPDREHAAERPDSLATAPKACETASAARTGSMAEDAAAGKPAGVGPEVTLGDAGVVARVRRRLSAAAAAGIVAASIVALTGWWWPAWFRGAAGTGLGSIAVVGLLLTAAALLRRARAWQRAEVASSAWVRWWREQLEAAAMPPEGWVTTVCGDPTLLHGSRGGVPMLRRLRKVEARVLPLRAASGPLASGDAVVVHGRVDGAKLAAGDALTVYASRRPGPILIARAADGAVFVAHRWAWSAG